MTNTAPIPVFTLFGETSAFPDVVHSERILDRAGQHDWEISPHRHSQMAQVFHIEKGHAKTMIDGVSAELKTGEYLYIPEKTVHGFSFSRGTEGLVLSFPSPVINRIAPQSPALSQWLSAPHQGALPKTAAPLLDAFVDNFSKHGVFRAQSLIALSHALILQLAENILVQGSLQEDTQDRNDPTRSRQMQDLDRLIATHLNTGWTASDYAQAMHVTTGHLSRITRDATGSGLAAYLEGKIMTEACRHLAFTRLSVSEVAYRLGFTDPSYFSRRFRTRMGETPSAYRARVVGQM